MSSGPLGQTSSVVEVTHVSSHGIWLLSGHEELFLPYDDFPWFKDVPLRKILRVEEPSPGHFHWPDLDVDLSTESIKHPERFPLQARVDRPRDCSIFTV